MSMQGNSRRGGRLYGYYRWLYRNGRPNRLAQLMNRLGAIVFSTGLLLPRRAGTLEVVGRRSGRLISFPIVITEFQGARYVVAMLGSNTNWVRNIYAAGGMAVLRHGKRETVHLDEVDPSERAPILRRYLEIAPGARPHLPVDRRASLAEFERIAAQYPVFHVTTVSPLLAGEG
jgi:deazaflavin-dependent oxidoreductase (nitroreductase family)